MSPSLNMFSAGNAGNAGNDSMGFGAIYAAQVVPEVRQKSPFMSVALRQDQQPHVCHSLFPSIKWAAMEGVSCQNYRRWKACGSFWNGDWLEQPFRKYRLAQSARSGPRNLRCRSSGPDNLRSVPAREVFVAGRGGTSSADCGDTILSVSSGESSHEYCATCQHGGRPLADRRMSRLLK